MTMCLEDKRNSQTDLHMHGVICVGQDGMSQLELENKLRKVFVGRAKNDTRKLKYFNSFKAIKVEACDVNRRNKTSKYTVVGNAMGALGYASKNTAKTKKLLGLDGRDTPRWVDNSAI